MAEVINMPRLSDTMEEGTVATWLKKVGDKVEEGDILAEIETDKATMEFESFYEGTLLHIGVQEGETTKVDQLLAIIGEEGEDISGLLNGSDTTPDDTEKPASEDESTTSDDMTLARCRPRGFCSYTRRGHRRYHAKTERHNGGRNSGDMAQKSR
jgi:pyruvate dehydrogenase E2 component (dihydrolipoamide acetyltransferase)